MTKHSRLAHNTPWLAALKGIILGLVIVAAFVSGFFVRDSLNVLPAQLVSAGSSDRYVLLTQVHELLERYYLRPLPEQVDLEYAAIRGLLGALNDPYTLFIDPPVAQSESQALAGQHGGIGVEVQYAADGRFLLYPYPDSPALKAGVEDGDVLLAINDVTLSPGVSMDEIRQALRGEIGSGNGVEIQVRKQASDEEHTYAIPFALIVEPSVIWRTLVEDGRIGYIWIRQFTSRTPQELRDAFSELEAQNIRALVFDVRNNSGGLLQEAIQTADEILDDGVIVYEQSRDDEKAYRAVPGGLGIDLPTAVLINQRTASAAELVAGALRDNNRAVLIGQNTFGKGSVQLIFPLADGSSVHITSAEWYTPNREPLYEQGLTPDIYMIPAEDGRDVELDEAVRQLQQQIQ